MQLYAKDFNDTLIAASKALRHFNYQCLECGEKVRVRGGLHRHSHFFHLKPAASLCKLHAKGMDHLEVQNHLLKLLPDGEAFLEHSFTEIGRIADVAWPVKKLIFEVQCSPISSQEIKQRTQAYRSIGYQVVWILHDKQFNRLRLSAAELSLQTIPHFFTNIDNNGNGLIYDQYSIFKKGMRMGKLERLPIDLSKPRQLTREISIEIPPVLKKRITHWPFYFSGDLIDRSMGLSNYLSLAIQPENKKSLWKRMKGWLWRFIGRPYTLLLQFFLERACR